MKRLANIVIAISLLSSLLVPVAKAANPVKAGATCLKLNQTVTVSRIRYKCIRSGKKFVWNKGNVQTSKPAPTPTSNATNKFEIPEIPTTFADLSAHLQGTIYSAWFKASEQVKNSSSKLGAVKISIGPNTKPTNLTPEIAFEATSRLYSNFAQAKIIHVIEYAAADMDWANAEYKKIQDQTWRSNFSTVINSNCPPPNCGNAMTQTNEAGDGIILIGEYDGWSNSEKYSTQAGHFNGSLEAHEFTHTVQFSNTPEFRYSMVPVWLMEGSAMWTAEVISSATYSDYVKLRDIDVHALYADASKYDANWIANFLNPNPNFLFNADNWQYWDQFPNYRRYDIGALATEILVSLKGPDAVMRLFVDVGQKVPFAEAFKSEFGISYPDAVTYISSAMALELSRGIRR